MYPAFSHQYHESHDDSNNIVIHKARTSAEDFASYYKILVGPKDRPMDVWVLGKNWKPL